MSVLSIKNILLLDGVDKSCADLLEASGISVTIKGKLAEAELLEAIKNYDAVVVRSATKITAAVLAAGTRLQLVGRAGTGTDNIDVEVATRRGIIVMNTPGGNTLSAAEHTCALICSLGRFLPQACASLKGGAWERKTFLGTELYGKTLAIIGLGRIGREVAKRMQSFGMTTIGYDPFVSAEAAAGWNIEGLSLAEIWPRADYITVHTPLLPHTRHLVGREVLLTKCKPGVKVVNVARGGIVDEEALLAALQEGRCGGAALDVFVEEPPTDLKLCQHPKVVCTPHLGANTVEAQKRVAVELAEQIVSGCAGEPLTGLVNAQALALAGSASSQPWISLATALGRLVTAVLGARGRVAGAAVSVHCYGQEVGPLYTAVCSAALAGLLNTETEGTANLVNATLLAQEMKVSLQKHSPASAERPIDLPRGVEGSITVTSTTNGTSCSATGSVCGGVSVLFSLDGSKWCSGGLVLVRRVLLYLAPSGGKALAAVAAAVAASGVTLYSVSASSSGVTDKSLFAATVTGTAEAPTDVAGLTFVGEVDFQ